MQSEISFTYIETHGGGAGAGRGFDGESGVHTHMTNTLNNSIEVFEQAYDIAVQIIELRERHGLTQAELAERCGVDQGDISRIERGSTSPTARTLQRIAEALDADVRLVDRAS